MKIISLLCFSFFIIACATTSGMKDRKGSGITKTYEYSYDIIFSATFEVSKQNNLELTDGGKEQKYMVLKRKVSKGTAILTGWLVVPGIAGGGELIAVFFTPKDSKTDVEVVSQKRSKIDAFAKDWTNNFFRTLEAELNSMNAKK
ncbi:MAG: hypothetical protein M1308_13790 [Actinobacteria bacterium]|nr:hypothetical protein [Actinomycetota bacterium]